MPGDSRLETDERDKLIGVIGLHVLHYHLFHVVDKKTFKVLWELHKKVLINFFLLLMLQLFSSCVSYFIICFPNINWQYLYREQAVIDFSYYF